MCMYFHYLHWFNRGYLILMKNHLSIYYLVSISCRTNCNWRRWSRPDVGPEFWSGWDSADLAWKAPVSTRGSGELYSDQLRWDLARHRCSFLTETRWPALTGAWNSISCLWNFKSSYLNFKRAHLIFLLEKVNRTPPGPKTP